MQFIPSDKTVTNKIIQNWKKFNSQSSSTRGKRKQQLVTMMPSIKNAFDTMGDLIVELTAEIESLKKKVSFYDENCSQESKSKLLQKNDKKRGFEMTRMNQQFLGILSSEFKYWFS